MALTVPLLVAVKAGFTPVLRLRPPVKLIVVLLSGATAVLHARAQSRRGLAIFGALTGLSALAALFLGVLLAE